MRLLRLPRLVVALVALSSALRGAADLPAASADRTPPVIQPWTAVIDAAAQRAIDLENVDLVPDANAPLPGDRLAALIMLRDGKREQQWLAVFTVAELTGKERENNPPKNLTLNANTGRVHAFSAGASLALDIEVVGPFSPGDTGPSRTRQARALMSPDFLAIGLDRTCELLIKLGEKHRSTAAATPEVAVPPAPLTSDEERVMLGFLPALMAFYQCAQETPGLREILWDVLEKPSLLSVLKNGGRVDTLFNLEGASLVSAGEHPWPRLPLHRLSLTLSLNGRPGLRCALFVTSPRPPLLTTAGVLAIAAQSPVHPGKRVDVRVLSARRPH